MGQGSCAHRYKLTKVYSSRGLPGKKFDHTWKRQAKNVNCLLYQDQKNWLFK